MSFFDIINYIFYKRNVLDHTPNEDDIQQFNPYMIVRWLSFYDSTQCVFVNETLNRFSSIDDRKTAVFSMFYNLIPKLKFKRVNYIKKTKDQKEDDDMYKLIAKSHDISTREVKMYMDLSL